MTLGAGIQIDANGRPRPMAWASEDEMKWLDNFRAQYGFYATIDVLPAGSRYRS
jgi:hypothetical protein